jgi:hypothetical protein
MDLEMAESLTSMSNTGNPAIPNVGVVQTDAGAITLLELPALKATLADLQNQSIEKLTEARSLRTLADDRYAELGTVLLNTPSPSLEDDHARQLLYSSQVAANSHR